MKRPTGTYRSQPILWAYFLLLCAFSFHIDFERFRQIVWCIAVLLLDRSAQAHIPLCHGDDNDLQKDRASLLGTVNRLTACLSIAEGVIMTLTALY